MQLQEMPERNKTLATLMSIVVLLENIHELECEIEIMDDLMNVKAGLPGIEIILSTDSTEIQCNWKMGDIHGEKKTANRECLLQMDSGRPRTINSSMLEKMDWDDIPEFTRDYADNISSFLQKLIIA